MSQQPMTRSSSCASLNQYMAEFRSSRGGGGVGDQTHNESCSQQQQQQNDDVSELTMSEYMTPAHGASGLHARIKHLEDELRNTQADKDFVWSLWRQLQVSNPDLTGAIACAIQREKDKAEQKDKKVNS